MFTPNCSSSATVNVKALFIEASDMKAEYDFSKLQARKNPYASKLKKPVTMRLSEDVVTYFKSMAEDAGIPYRSLINLYLRDCLANSSGDFSIQKYGFFYG